MKNIYSKILLIGILSCILAFSLSAQELAELAKNSKVQQFLDSWLKQQNLNQYGDAPDTAYIGGNPLFDMLTGTSKDRYLYLLEKFPKLVAKAKKLAANVASSKSLYQRTEVRKFIDDWLKGKNLNGYGDAPDTAYIGGNPLFDMTTGESQDRYLYLAKKFPKLAATVEKKFSTSTSAKVPLHQRKEVQKFIDDWLKEKNLNAYGDAPDTAYIGGNPLFDMTTGKSRNRQLYLLKRFPELQTAVKNKFADVKKNNNLSLFDKLHALTQREEVKKNIDKWLKERNLNEFGDPPGTFYAGGNPLFDMSTGKAKDRYLYLVKKFPQLAFELLKKFGE